MQTTTQTPPWITLWNMLRASIGNSPYVTVELLNTKKHPFIISVRVNNHENAVAIASIIKLQYSWDGILLNVQVKDKSGKIAQPIILNSLSQLIRLTQKALKNNLCVEEIISQPLMKKEIKSVFIIFKKEVIQFYNDDMQDLYQNYNNVVALVFREVLLPHLGGYSLNCSTALN